MTKISLKESNRREWEGVEDRLKSWSSSLSWVSDSGIQQKEFQANSFVKMWSGERFTGEVKGIEFLFLTCPLVDSVARSGWRFPAQKLTKTRPLQQKPAQNFNCQNNVIWFYYHVNQD